MTHKINIITPVLNGEKHIRTAIESVLAQGNVPYEHIVVDGGSTDATVSILKSYPHLKWISEPDKGTGDAFNKGCRMATGDIIVMLPADDCFKPGAFEQVFKTFSEHVDCAWVAGYCGIINDDGNEIRRWITLYKNFLLRHHSFNLLLTECYLSAMAVFFKTSLMSELGPFDIYATTEYAIWLSIASQHKLYVVKEYLASFRVSRGSMTGSFRNFPATRALLAAKKYRGSHPLAFAVHYCNYLKLLVAYSILNRLLK